MSVYQKLKKRYCEYFKNKNNKILLKKYNNTLNNNKYEFDDLVVSLLLRYETLGAEGHQWAMNESMKNKMNEVYGANFECFASSFNHYYKYYCSMFYDIEKYFMSCGTFQNVKYNSGFYIANPFYEEQMLNNMVSTFENYCEKSNKSLTFLFGLPDWTKKGYGKFDALINAKKSKYNTYCIFIKSGKIPWFDYKTGETRKITGGYRIAFQSRKTKKIKKKELDNIIYNFWIQ